VSFATLHITIPIVVSFITSVIVNVIGFVIGARIAKDRADRSGIRELYKSVFSHFRDMRDVVQSGIPRTWNSYLTPRTSDPEPLIFKYIKNGTLNQFPHKIGEACKDLEKDALVSGLKFRSAIEESFSKKLVAWGKQNLRAASQPVSGRRNVMYHAGQLFLREKSIEEISDYLEVQDIGVRIELSTEGSTTRPIYIMRENLVNGDTKAALTEIKALVAGDHETQAAAGELKAVEARLSDLLATLAKRINDPHPIRETITGSLSDIFRG